MNTIDNARAAIAALDFSAENERIADIEAEISRMQAAIEKAEARCTELAHAKMGLRAKDATAIADAILADVSPTEAAAIAPSAEVIDSERNALRAAITDLRHRIQDARDQITKIQREASSKTRDVVRPLVEALQDQARQAGENIVEIFASVSAISRAFGDCFDLEADKLGRGVENLASHRGIIHPRRNVDTPIDILSIIEGARGKGRALPVRYAATINMP